MSDTLGSKCAESLEKRLQAIESSNRRLKAGASVLAVLLLCALSLGQTKPATNGTTEPITIRDAQGRTDPDRVIIVRDSIEAARSAFKSSRRVFGTALAEGVCGHTMMRA